MIRHGASLVRAFAAARVPKLTVVLRKSYGGAYITMNSRDLGSDLVLAWPAAELGIMSARAAVGIVNRRELRVGDGPRGRARPGWPRPTRRSTCEPTPPLPPDTSTRSSSPRRRVIVSPTRSSRSRASRRSPSAASLERDPRRQAPADHRRDHEGLDRLPRRRAGAERGRRDRADELRPRQADDRARRPAAPQAGRRARARRQPRGGPRGAHRVAARALGRDRRGAARDRVRAAGRARRTVHDGSGGQRPAGVHDERVLAEGAGGGVAAADGPGRVDRGAGLRRLGGMADL